MLFGRTIDSKERYVSRRGVDMRGLNPTDMHIKWFIGQV